jgi:simple sugar transport system permease protein
MISLRSAVPPLKILGVTALLGAVGMAILFRLAGADIIDAFAALAAGAFGSQHALLETLSRATPLILTGLSVAVAFRAKLWSIGAEGQLFAGAIAGYGAMLLVPGPIALSLPVTLLAGFAGGAFYGALAGFLKVRRGVDEVMSTVMLNYIIQFILSFLLLNGPWSDPASAFQQTPYVPHSAEYPLLIPHSHLHAGFAVALVAALIIHIVMTRSSFGYDLKALGENPRAYAAKLGDAGRVMVRVMAVSGGLAGLAGVCEIFGTHHRLLAGISPGYGYTGIIIAILARYQAGGIVVAAILFGGLVNAAIRLQIMTSVPSAASAVIQALLLFSFLIAGRRHVA